MLTLICGIPGAGKTTFSNKYSNVIHLDDYLKYGKRESFTQCSKIASKEKNVCVEGIFNTRLERRVLLFHCRHLNPKVCIWIDPGLEECLKREKGGKKRPPFITLKYNANFEPPSINEGWDKIIRIK